MKKGHYHALSSKSIYALSIFQYSVICLASTDRESGLYYATPCYSIYAPSCNYDILLPESSTPKLLHLSKDRPKTRKTHACKRPVIRAESILIEDEPLDRLLIINGKSPLVDTRFEPDILYKAGN